MTVLRDSEGGEDIEVSDDPDGYHTLNISKVPLFVTLSKVRKTFRTDAPSQFKSQNCLNTRFIV